MLTIMMPTMAFAEAFTRVVVPDNGLQVQSSGSTLNLTLSRADAISKQSLMQTLGGNAKSIIVSPDGKRYTITLAKPFRVRQFLSNKGAGFDVMGIAETNTETASASAATPSAQTVPSAPVSATSDPNATSFNPATVATEPTQPAVIPSAPKPITAANPTQQSETNKKPTATEQKQPTQPLGDDKPAASADGPKEKINAASNKAMDASADKPRKPKTEPKQASERPITTAAKPPKASSTPKSDVASKPAAAATEPTQPRAQKAQIKVIDPEKSEAPASQPEPQTPPDVSAESKSAESTSPKAALITPTRTENEPSPKPTETDTSQQSEITAAKSSEETQNLSNEAQPKAAPKRAANTFSAVAIPQNADMEFRKPEAKKPSAKKKPEAAQTAQPSTPPPLQKPVAEASAPKEPTSLVLGITPKGNSVDITFPWTHRVASALYQRDRDWWLVFSAPSTIDLAQTRSILPTNISQFRAFSVSGYSVFHMVTDGKVTMRMSQTKGSYEWQLSVGDSNGDSPDAYALEPYPESNTPYVLIRAYDVAQELRITDPKYGDRLLIIPSFEANKALITSYTSPEFAVLPPKQGIVLNLQDESLQLSRGRDGIRIGKKEGLAISANIPSIIAESAAEALNAPDIMFPYARWRVAAKDFATARMAKTDALAFAPEADKPKALLDLATLYLGQGMPEEALSLINQLRDRFPDYYTDNQVAMLRAGANFLMFRMGDAASDIMSEELADNPETQLWKDAISLFVPQILEPISAPAAIADETKKEDEKSGTSGEAEKTIAVIAPEPRFDYLAYNRDYIRHYPPKMRQKLAIIAADNFVARGEYRKATRTLDILNRDELLADIMPYAQFLLGRIAADSGKPEDAMKLWRPLAKQYDDLFIHARASFSLAALEHSEGKKDAKETIKTLERLRVVWRGDTLEEKLLSYLGQLYYETEDYANALRTWKEYTKEYGGSAEGLETTNKMAELFERLFGEEALADTMDPLKSLALFYEFRELSPIGARGDDIIQKLADRLAKVDLLDKASELLEHQVKHRVQGETRAKIGAQLALLNLLNKKPEKALDALEMSGYGTASPALADERNRLAALSLAKLKKTDVALEMLAADNSAKGKQLRLEILWEAQDWPNVINVAEDILGARADIASPLTEKETETLLKLALAYSFESDGTQLKYLREYYGPLLKASPYRDIFEHITNDTALLDPEDFDLVAKQISNTESFLKTFKGKIAQGRLSTTMEEEPSEEETRRIESERNKQLVPESQQIENQVEDEQETPDNASADSSENNASPQRAPVKVEDSNTP